MDPEIDSSLSDEAQWASWVQVHLVMAVGIFAGSVVKSITGFGSTIAHLCIWSILQATTSINTGTLQQAIVTEVVFRAVTAVPYLLMTNARHTADLRLVVSISLFQTVGSPLGAFLLTRLDLPTLELAMAGAMGAVLVGQAVAGCIQRARGYKTATTAQAQADTTGALSGLGGPEKGSCHVGIVKGAGLRDKVGLGHGDGGCGAAGQRGWLQRGGRGDGIQWGDEETGDGEAGDEERLPLLLVAHKVEVGVEMSEMSEMSGQPGQHRSHNTADAAGMDRWRGCAMTNSTAGNMSGGGPDDAGAVKNAVGGAALGDNRLSGDNGGTGGVHGSANHFTSDITSDADGGRLRQAEHSVDMSHLPAHFSEEMGGHRGWCRGAVGGTTSREWCVLLGAGSVAGTLSGVMGGLTGVDGPPTIFLFTALGAGKDVVRGTNAVINVALVTVLLVAYAIQGIFVMSDLSLYLVGSVVGLAGTYWGNTLAGALNPTAFARTLQVMVAVCAALMLASGLGWLPGHDSEL